MTRKQGVKQQRHAFLSWASQTSDLLDGNPLLSIAPDRQISFLGAQGSDTLGGQLERRLRSLTERGKTTITRMDESVSRAITLANVRQTTDLLDALRRDSERVKNLTYTLVVRTIILIILTVFVVPENFWEWLAHLWTLLKRL